MEGYNLYMLTEKNLVMDMIKSALSSTEDYYNTQPQGQFIDERPRSVPQDFLPNSQDPNTNGQLPANEENLMHKIDRWVHVYNILI